MGVYFTTAENKNSVLTSVHFTAVGETKKQMGNGYTLYEVYPFYFLPSFYFRHAEKKIVNCMYEYMHFWNE